MGKWFGKDEVEIPTELEGLTPQQIVEAAKAAKALEGRVSEIDQLKARLAEMEANPKVVEKIVEVERRADPAIQQQQNQPIKPISFLDDEDQAFNQRATPIVQAVFAVGAQTSRMTFENGLKGLDRKMYDKYGAEVDALMQKEPAQNQASPYAWKSAWEMIKGRHVDDIIKAKSDNTEFFAAESTGDFSAGPIKAQDNNILTEDEKKQAKKYGLTESDFLEQKKGMTIYHG